MKISRKQIQEAVAVLQSGGTVVFPTSTAYGLAVDATNEAAVKKLYQLKGRSFKKPVHLIVQSLEQAKYLVKFNKTAEDVAGHFWPGPVTLVLPLKKHSASLKILSAKTKTLGVRLPDNQLIASLVVGLGKPITATSANVSDQPTPYNIETIRTQYAKSKVKPDYYLDAGQLKTVPPSTIIQVDGRHVTLLRKGPVDFHKIIQLL